MNLAKFKLRFLFTYFVLTLGTYLSYLAAFPNDFKPLALQDVVFYSLIYEFPQRRGEGGWH